MTMRAWTRLGTMTACLVALPAIAFAQWESPTRAFHKDTAFPLEGRHLTVACASCHVNGVTKGTPTTCEGCHWIRRQDDVYRTRLGTSCEQCHRPMAWRPARWNHAEATGVPLNPSHQTLTCDTCHANGEFTNPVPTCVTCHQPDFDRTREPDHRAAGFPTTCEQCHRVSDVTFAEAHFDHAAVFPLTGVHATQACSACHVDARYQGTPRDCIGCHRGDYERTASPNHVAGGFSTACETCHGGAPSTWLGASATGFNHAAVFPLVGVHATQGCASCHLGGRYTGTPRDCIGCHRVKYEATKNPNHVAAGYSTACESCHRATDAAWTGARVDHNQFFPLVGVHATQPCATCHAGDRYKGTPRDCIGCHRSDYDATKTPNHAAAGYSTSCEGCHRATDSTWLGAKVDHNQYYPLVGRHSTASCSACHGSGVYKGTPTTCVACHKVEFDKTTNPNHLGAGFPLTCEVCHGKADASWTQGKFSHPWFPITSGKHAGNSCSACHTNPANYASFTCLTCHERTKMDDKHKERPGYKYDSLACYSCHPTGKED